MSNTWLGYAGTIGELTVSTQNPKHKKGKLVLLTKKSNDLNLPRKKKGYPSPKKPWNLEQACYSWLVHGFHISGLCSWYFMVQPGFEKQLK
jgi:hypothetical protein